MKDDIFKNLEPWFSSHNLTWLGARTIFLTVHGSRCYGTNTPESDVDLKGLCIPPKEYFLGYAKNFEQAEGKEPYDMVIYDLRKFMKLAADANPNIIEVLFTEPEDWVIETPLFHKLRDNRNLFLSRKARWSFSGYAMSQLKRIKSHKKWLLNPPTHKPTREEYGLPTDSKMSQSDLGATKALVDKNVPLDDNVMRLFQKEQQYQAAKKNWDQYQNWVKTRNKKRAELEAKFSYDVKHASHLIRLMRMCREILSEGKVLVKRPDAEELKAVRSGAWSYEELIEWAEQQERDMEELYKNSPLPHKPDHNKLDKLCQELVEEALRHYNLRNRSFSSVKGKILNCS